MNNQPISLRMLFAIATLGFALAANRSYAQDQSQTIVGQWEGFNTEHNATYDITVNRDLTFAWTISVNSNKIMESTGRIETSSNNHFIFNCTMVGGKPAVQIKGREGVVSDDGSTLTLLECKTDNQVILRRQ